MNIELRGVAVVFGEETARGPAELIRPGAFRHALTNGHPVRLETLHAGDHHVFARTSTGTMRVLDHPDGLFFAADLNLADPQALNLVRAVEAGLRHCSVSFRPLVVHERTDGVAEVVEARLREISVVGLPCYERTGCWLADEDWLPGPLAELRSIWREPPPMQQPFLDPISNRVCFRERAA